MNLYSHLTIEERENILKYHTLKMTITQIANVLDRNKSTISRELRRNSDLNGYSPSKATSRYLDRRKNCHPVLKLSDPGLFAYVKEKFLNEQWSPEQIQGRLKLENAQWSISYSTIYRAIYAHMFDEPGLSHGNRGAIRKLRHRGKSRHTKDYVERRGKIRISHDIEERSTEAENRSRIGDWEADTVAGIVGKACLVTLVDRKSRYLLGGKAQEKKADAVNQTMIDALRDQPCESITPDRGKEFAKHEEVTQELKVEFYFPKPHHPWQRGSNENTNGLIREYLPRGQDLSKYSQEEVQEIFSKINKRPRKCLGYLTPYEVYKSESLHLV